MTIRRDPMSRHGAIEEAVRQAGGWARAAELTGRSEKHLRNASNPQLTERHAVDISFGDACALVRQGGKALLDHLAHEAGSKLMAVPQSDDDAALHTLLAGLGMSAGEAIMVISRVLEDGVVTPAERVEARKVLLALQGVITRWLTRLAD